MKPKITPCLWFDFNAEEAVAFYLRSFGNGRILRSSRYGDAMPQHKGKVMLIEFELFGQPFQALNGGPQFRFTEALSLSVDCEDQAEVDRLWAALSDGGTELPCGWIKDRYGLAWQIVPRGMIEMHTDSDPVKARRAAEAMMFTMKKIDIAAVRRAFDG